MDLVNGYIAFYKQTGGGYDNDRNPIPSTWEMSTFIDCNINQITREQRVFVDGEWVLAKYNVYFSKSNIPQGHDITEVTRVQLKNIDDVVLGEYYAHSNQPLAFFSKIKLTLRDA